MNLIISRFLIAVFVLLPFFAFAQEDQVAETQVEPEVVEGMVEDLAEENIDTSFVSGDFAGDYALQPARIEVFLKPGEELTEYFTFTNRTENTRKFVVDLEDFTSGEGDSAVKLLGQEAGPFSLKKFLFPQVTSFTLAPNEQIKLPVTIRVPFNAEPGGRFGSVIFKLDSDSDDPGVQTVSRVGALILAQIEGDIVEESELTRFEVNNRRGGLFLKGPFDFDIEVENTGNVHTVPFATLDITNMTGKTVESFPVSAYFVLPKSKRTKSILWDADFAFGRYTATLNFNHGHSDLEETQEVKFWVIPLKVIIVVIAIFLIFMILGMALGRRR